MPVNTKILFHTAILFTVILMVSCTEEKKKDPPKPEKGRIKTEVKKESETKAQRPPIINICLLYTSDAADERSSVDLGGRRIIKKKKRT